MAKDKHKVDRSALRSPKFKTSPPEDRIYKTKQFTIYIPPDKGLSMDDLVFTCKQAQGPATSLHPIMRCEHGLAVTRPEGCPNSLQNIWKFKMINLSNLKLSKKWPWICDNWRDSTDWTGYQFILPWAEDDQQKPMRGPSSRYYFYKKHFKLSVKIYPNDCPKDVIDAVKEAFDRAGYGKPKNKTK